MLSFFVLIWGFGFKRPLYFDQNLFQQFRQLFQTADCFIQNIGTTGKVHPDQMVHRFPEEAGTRHSCHADLPDHPLAEFQICPSLKLRQSEKFRNIDHHKIGSLRHIVLQAHTVQPGKKVVALFCVKGLQVFVVACRQFQTGHSGFLQRCSRTHSKEICTLRAPSITSAGPMR